MRTFFGYVEAGHFELGAHEIVSLGDGLTSYLHEARILQKTARIQERISAPDLVRALRRAYGITASGLAFPSVLDERPVLLGWTGDGPDEVEVVLVARPKLALAKALTGPWRRLVLVPTGKTLDAMRRQRHGPGAFLEVEALSESLFLHLGKLHRRVAQTPDDQGDREANEEHATAARASPKAAAGTASPEPGRGPWIVRTRWERIPGAKAWTDVRISKMEPGLVRIDLPGRSVRCTPADLGMLHPRSRRPTAMWEALMHICVHRGTFKTRSFGGVDATKKLVSRLRARLRDVFGLGTSPFYRYRKAMGWTVRFKANTEHPGDGLLERRS